MRSFRPARRLVAAVAIAGALGLSAAGSTTAHAAGPPATDPSGSSVAVPPADPNSAVDAAKQQLAQAQAQVAAAKAAAAASQLALEQAQAALAALQAKVAALIAEVSRDQATVKQLQVLIAADRVQLSSFMRAQYETAGPAAMVSYVFGASDISGVVRRSTEVSHITDAGRLLIDRINAEQAQAQTALDRSITAQHDAEAARLQMETQTVIIANQTAQAQVDAVNATQNLTDVRHQLAAAQDAATAYNLAKQMLADARSEDMIFAPLPGPLFTQDSDLTVPSQLDAPTIDKFLAGTALAGLGASYLKAEQTYHVSARYLVAHSIEESAWGSSQIAHDKHNLFGYGADDGDPYNHAVSFASFDACIQFVAQRVETNYLLPKGSFYHGPTLHGMNVNYASDPYWAMKISNIARTIPTPDGASQGGGGTWPGPPSTAPPSPAP